MVFIARATPEVSRPDDQGKVIKAQDFWAYRRSRQAIAEAMQKRDAIIASATADFEREKQRGYLEGQETARLEQSAHMIDIVSQTVDYFARVEVQMVDLVMDAVKRLVCDFSDRDQVVKVVKNSLALVRSQKSITVKVHPSQVSAIEACLSSLIDSFPSIEHIDVVGESMIPADACVIESDIGRVEASMTGQIEALKAAFEKVFGVDRSFENGAAHHQLPEEIVFSRQAVKGTDEASLPPNVGFSGG